MKTKVHHVYPNRRSKMDLIIAMVGLVYLIGLVVTPVLVRILPGLNKYLHENINAPNPAVVATVIWPIVVVYISIYHTFKLVISIINWVSGNGFITKSKPDCVRLSDYEY
jgi:hypothetical protein